MGIKTERRAIESTYDDLCDIYTFVKSKTNGITGTAKEKANDSPLSCALSQKALNATAQSDTANNIGYDAKLFIAPEIVIAPGSVIEVSRYGRLYEFESAGEAFVYATHQEIMLRRRDRA